ncbi:MAG: tRNA epoxyqueuosine(34) reductase QueG [Chloroflexota bacterium]
MTDFSLEQLKQHVLAQGFNVVGVIRAEPAPTLDAYFAWINAGMHGKMGYMARADRQRRRRDLNVILPGVRSLILVGMDYRTLPIPGEFLQAPARGRIASYAWGLDYHDLMTPRLEALADWLQKAAGLQHHRVYVDTGAILERSHAQQAGMGFIGKNTMLIHPRRGSYFFIGEILTDLTFDHYDQPHRATMCGSCTRCLVACPTDAFPRPYVLDARRCISYLTIENKGWIDRELRSMMGNWVFGCDVCQDVCPWQRFSVPTDQQWFIPDNFERAAPLLTDLLSLDDQRFKALFDGSPVARIKRDRMVRNACVAAGNWGDPIVLPHLLDLLADRSPLVRGHAAWALSQIGGAQVGAELNRLRMKENDEDVKAEVEYALENL